QATSCEWNRFLLPQITPANQIAAPHSIDVAFPFDRPPHDELASSSVPSRIASLYPNRTTPPSPDMYRNASHSHTTRQQPPVLHSNVCTYTKMQHPLRSEEHTSELQSRFDLVCRPLLEK